jgi:hypothetical protein
MLQKHLFSEHPSGGQTAIEFRSFFQTADGWVFGTPNPIQTPWNSCRRRFVSRAAMENKRMADENRTPERKIGEIAHAENQAERTTGHQPGHGPGNPDQEQRTRDRAYQLWEADGAPEGNAEHYWYRAQELIEREEKPDLSVEQLNDLA